MIRTTTLALALVAGAAAADPRTYDGREAAAIACAHGLITTSAVLGRSGLLSGADKEFASLVASAILARYVSGTTQQKLAALRALDARRSAGETLDRFRANLRGCQRQFPL